jgi:predicted permease
MRIRAQLTGLLRSLVRSDRLDTDLADEMRFHIEREADANVARGMSREDALRAARLTFGSVDASHEQSRDERPGAGLRRLAQDIRFGIRLLRKSPVFGVTAIAIIALGVGAATAIFSVVYGVILRPLPYRDPAALVSIWLAGPTARIYPSAADANELRQLRGVFTDIALIRSSNANLSLVGDGDPQRLDAARVSPNLFAVLGVSPALGRAFASDENQAGRDHVVLLSDAFWRARFGADRSIIGRQIRLDGVMSTVIGVMPPSFQYPNTGLDAWIPAVIEPGELTRQTVNNYRLIARLDSRTTLDAARRETAALAKRLGSSYHPATWTAGPAFTIDSMLEDAIRTVRPALLLLIGAVSFLLLIACVNLSNLFGARATARSGEFAVRLALGATRSRLIAQAFAEAAPVLVIGGVFGVLVAHWAVHAFIANAPAGLPRVESIALSGPVIAYSLALIVATGLAASLAPAMQAWRSDFTTVTKDSNRSATGGRRRATARRIGVAAQVAFALPLLVGASLLIQSAIELGRVNLGFNPKGLATLAFEVRGGKHVSPKQIADYYAELVAAVRAVPGVSSAAIVNRIPLVGAQTNPIDFTNSPDVSGEEVWVDSRTVTPDYFATLGIPLVSGRTFSENDEESSPVVAIIDEKLAHATWPGQSALGKRFRGSPRGDWVTIVGVVGHVRTTSVDADPRPQVYWSTRQWTQARSVLAVRSELEPAALLPAVVRAIRSVDPEQSVFDLRSMQDIVDRSVAQRRLTTMLMTGFGAISLLLAAIGIYGVVAYGVTQRLREFGIRLALGATGQDVTRTVVWQGMSMALAGSLVGIVLAAAVTGAMRDLVFGVAPTDAVSFGLAVGGLLLVTAIASYLPARRAAAVDPGVTLRAE